VLTEYDLVGSFVLGGLYGQFETAAHLSATWSNLSLETRPGAMGFRLRSKAADTPDDFIRHRNLESSVCVLNGFAEILTSTGLAYMATAELANEKTGAENGPLEPAHTKQ
jgi:hypothetical protein